MRGGRRGNEVETKILWKVKTGREDRTEIKSNIRGEVVGHMKIEQAEGEKVDRRRMGGGGWDFART